MPDNLPALMFNAVGPALGDWWMPLSKRQAVADALYAVVRPELEQLRRCVPLACSDERHSAKVEALQAENARLEQLREHHDGLILENLNYQERDEQLRTERDGAYRERAQLLAYLAAAHESHIGYTDPDVPTWPVLTIEAPTGQMCWHINPADLDLFGHVPQVDPVAIGWDGHTTEEKYERLAALVTRAAERCCACGSAAVVYHNYREQPFCQPCADGDEWTCCASPHCPNGERYPRLEERGWTSGGMGTWLCPDHKPEDDRA